MTTFWKLICQKCGYWGPPQAFGIRVGDYDDEGKRSLADICPSCGSTDVEKEKVAEDLFKDPSLTQTGPPAEPKEAGGDG